VDDLDLRSAQYWDTELSRRICDADVFYLFWCRHAMASEWVKKEWHWALQSKGLDFIDPVPLEGQEYAPPPGELAAGGSTILFSPLSRRPAEARIPASLLMRNGSPSPILPSGGCGILTT
jgi:hypothetical protein